MIFTWLLLILSTVCATFFIQYHWSRRRLYALANSLPGPPALPIVGNGLCFLGQTKDILKAFEIIIRGYPKPLRFWLGPTLVIYFADPNHIEKILTSKAITYKHDIYHSIRIYLGGGLIADSGRKFKRNKKLIQPLLNSKFIHLCTLQFEDDIELCMKQLEKHVDQGTFDINVPIHMCCIDLLSDSMMGVRIGAQIGQNRDYIEAIPVIYDQVYKRMVKPWYHSDLLFALIGNLKHQNNLLKKIETFFKPTIAEARKRVQSRKTAPTEDEYVPIIDQIIRVYEEQSVPLSHQDIIDHILTLFVASEDTITQDCSFLCVFLGMYPQCQVKAAQEIREVLGEQIRPVLMEDLTKLTYLEMCVKEGLRVVPIAPFILRKTTEDFEIDNMTIPEGCAVVVSIYDVHRDRKYWERPGQFYPEHFLPEAVNKRHPYAYVPFSAGPRACIGQPLALIVIKLIMANILQRFEIEADGKLTDLNFRADISIRSIDGYHVRLKKRVWN